MTQTTDRSSLSLGVLGIIVLVTAIWGFNFIVIKVGVQGVPPLLLASLRFVFSVFPAILFVRKPAASWGKLAAYGLLLGMGEFGFLFTAIKLGAPTGVSSVVMQSQAFFTALIAAVVLRERIGRHSLIGMAVAGIGLALIARSNMAGSDATVSIGPISMVVAAAFFWAASNVVAQRMPNANGLSLMVWSSLFSLLPLFVLSYFFERESFAGAFANLKPISIGALLYLVCLSTLFGYGVWNQLIMRHGARRIAPFSLLVPVFGVTSSALVLRERITTDNAIAAACILLGLAIHVFGGLYAKNGHGRNAHS